MLKLGPLVGEELEVCHYVSPCSLNILQFNSEISKRF